jgi:hypothetical protein
MAAFFSKTYQKGLGEFWYINKLDPRTPVTFPANTKDIQKVKNSGTGQLIGIGGGKDSLVTVELLREKVANLTTWSLNHRPQLTPLIDRIGLPHCWVERELDPQLATLQKLGARNGHIPLSAILACVGTIVAILSGNHDVVVSNEHSANEPTLVYQNVEINHQYSKSEEFEADFQEYLKHNFGETVRYYSFLRPLTELRISEIFAQIGFEKYKDVFSSCNRAYVHGSQRMSWCGECPKCAFVFLALSPFLPQQKLETLWGNKNLLLEPKLEPIYRQLLGISCDKPLECIGETVESRAAILLLQRQYPELKNKYNFDPPKNYDFRKLASDKMPKEIREIFTKVIAHVASEAQTEKEAIQWVRRTKNKSLIFNQFASLKEFTRDSKPIVVFTAGSPGAGKTEFLKNFSKRIEDTQESKPVTIDPDAIRNFIPGYTGGNAYLFQRAVSIAVDDLFRHTIKNNQNILFDGTLANYKNARQNIEISISKYDSVIICYVFQHPAIAWRFTQLREKVEGRNIRSQDFINKFLQAKNTVDAIKAEFEDKINLNIILKDYKDTKENRVVAKVFYNVSNVEECLPFNYTVKDIERIMRDEIV